MNNKKLRKELKLARFLLECDIDASRLMTEWYKEIRKTAVVKIHK